MFVHVAWCTVHFELACERSILQFKFFFEALIKPSIFQCLYNRLSRYFRPKTGLRFKDRPTTARRRYVLPWLAGCWQSWLTKLTDCGYQVPVLPGVPVHSAIKKSEIKTTTTTNHQPSDKSYQCTTSHLILLYLCEIYKSLASYRALQRIPLILF